MTELLHEDTYRLAELVTALGGAERLAEDLRGRSGKLRPSKPTRHTGLHQYLWRMARFHAGHDMTMPVTCGWDLSDWLEEQGLRRLGALYDERDKQLTGLLDVVVDKILDILGEDKNKAARRWGRALGVLA